MSPERGKVRGDGQGSFQVSEDNVQFRSCLLGPRGHQCFQKPKAETDQTCLNVDGVFMNSYQGREGGKR